MKYTMLIASMILSGTAVLAGGASTGGGGAFVCRDKNTGKIQDSELLDLWEGRFIWDWNIPVTNEPVDQQMARALLKLSKVDTGLYQLTLLELAKIQVTAKYLPPEVTLPPPTDALPQYSKTDCPLEGMMLYDGSLKRLNISEVTFSHLLNNTNKAAAWIHETIYKILRDVTYQADSRQARKLTACLFSSDDCLGAAGYSVPNNGRTYKCSNSSQEFFVYPDGNSFEVRYMRLGSSIFGGLLAEGWDPKAGKLSLLGILNKFGYVTAHMYWNGQQEYQNLKLSNGSIFHRVIGYDFELLATGEIVKSDDAICELVH